MKTLMRINKKTLGVIASATWVLSLVTLMTLKPVAASTNDSRLEGIWRGKLEVQPGVALVVGVDVQGDTVTLDSPNQGLWGHQLSSFTIDGDSFTFSATDLSAEFSGTIRDNVIVGTFTQGRARPLTLQRLTAEDLKRLAYEAGYRGNLVINNQQNLPLQVNVAVIANDFYATLDSPAQQSYGIPLTDFTMNERTMSFASPMIKASFEGESEQAGVYTGKFVQGLERPLTLKKINNTEEQVSVPKIELGEYGGAIAVITPTGAASKFFADHNEQTQYEIGSVTKTMVAYLLAQSMIDDTVAPEQPITAWFAAAPDSITLNQLVTHTSGLPRLPSDLFNGADANDPYAHYTLSHLEQALATVELSVSNQGAESYEYSNFGFGVLAEALAKANQLSFSQLISEQLFKPLGMTASSVALTSAPADKLLAQGHSGIGQAVPAWHFQALAGAGAVRANLSDMIRYVEAMMALSGKQDPLAQQLFAPQFAMGDCCQQALGWILKQDPNGKWFAWHNGQTAGFGAYVGFYLDGSRGVVVLNNQSFTGNIDAEQLLQGSAQLHE